MLSLHTTVQNKPMADCKSNFWSLEYMHQMNVTVFVVEAEENKKINTSRLKGALPVCF